MATHTDRAHIHNHIVYNSVSMDGSRKFRNFWLSSFALQRVSDLICLENGLSVITPRPYSERDNRADHKKRETVRQTICDDIDAFLSSRPEDFAEFLKAMEAAGYEVKQGKHPAVKGKGQKRFVRFSSLPEGYREDDIRAFLSGERSMKVKRRQRVVMRNR